MRRARSHRVAGRVVARSRRVRRVPNGAALCSARASGVRSGRARAGFTESLRASARARFGDGGACARRWVGSSDARGCRGSVRAALRRVRDEPEVFSGPARSAGAERALHAGHRRDDLPDARREGAGVARDDRERSVDRDRDRAHRCVRVGRCGAASGLVRAGRLGNAHHDPAGSRRRRCSDAGVRRPSASGRARARRDQRACARAVGSHPGAVRLTGQPDGDAADDLPADAVCGTDGARRSRSGSGADAGGVCRVLRDPRALARAGREGRSRAGAGLGLAAARGSSADAVGRARVLTVSVSGAEVAGQIVEQIDDGDGAVRVEIGARVEREVGGEVEQQVEDLNAEVAVQVAWAILRR